jgi:branched-subunit amino acid transport protein
VSPPVLPLAAVLVLAAGTYAMRLVGPLSRDRVRLPARVAVLLDDGTVVLLAGLVAVSALTQGAGLAGWARPAGVLVAGVLVLRRAPFPVVVVAAALTTALLRLAGVP